jgi:hypothetical protein
MIDVMHLKSFVIDENICEGGQQSLSSCKTGKRVLLYV